MSSRERDRDRDRDREGTGRVSHGGRARRTDPRKRSAQRPAERGRSGDPARTVAYESLRAVSDGAYANLDLPPRLRRARLDRQDAAFVTELVYGVTRMRGLYDAIIDRCAGRDLDRIDPPVLDILRLGVHQLLGMRVPVHAAVDTTVALARAVVGAGAASFTNAVLRRVSETPAPEWLALVAPGAENDPPDLEDLAVATSHPAWIVRALRRSLLAHGASTEEGVDADLRALLESHNTPAPVTLVARPGLADVAELIEAGASPGDLSPYAAVLRDGGDPGRLPAVREGRAAVQDEGSQLVVRTLLAAYDALTAADTADRADSTEGSRWLDLCAGPGGKAGLLAAEAMTRGATLFANEISEHRAALVESAVGAALDAGADVFVGVGDGRTVGAEEPGGFDLVLVDAPCTGLGALRRRPDARWRRVPGDVGDLVLLQEELLTSALDAVRPGGLVGYATCSPHEAETLGVVTRVARSRSDVEMIDLRPFVSDETLVTIPSGQSLQTWTFRHKTDGMFLTVFRRLTD
ncbi:MAG: transcription antitermination factor NusB [Mobilicoccus sp.]|nr:transcription antitermination factor NusB [Mobilicoccus sp.]